MNEVFKAVGGEMPLIVSTVFLLIGMLLGVRIAKRFASGLLWFGGLLLLFLCFAVGTHLIGYVGIALTQTGLEEYYGRLVGTAIYGLAGGVSLAIITSNAKRKSKYDGLDTTGPS